MSYPSDPPSGAYPYHAVSVPTTAGYSSSSDTASGPSSAGANSSGTDYSTDGYSSSTSNGNGANANTNCYAQDFGQQQSGTYQQQHYQHALVGGNPYPPHPHQYPAPLAPNPAYDHHPESEIYAAAAAPIQHHHNHHNHPLHPQQQHHNMHQQQQQQPPAPMAPPAPQPIHPAPTQQQQQHLPQRQTPVVPSLPQGAPVNRQQQAAQQQYQRIARFVGPPPVALACTECRARHLKCDAGIPACNRCKTDGRECSYVKSRRGWKGTRRKKIQTAVAAADAAAAVAAKEEEKEKASSGNTSDGTASGDNNTPAAEGKNGTQDTAATPKPRSPPAASSGQCTSFSKNPLPIASTPSTSSSTTPPTDSPLDTLRNFHKNSTTFPSMQELPVPISPTANLLQLYYAYFNSAHPFILPGLFLIRTNASQLTILLPVIRFVGSFFAQSAPTEAFRADAEKALFNSPPRNAFTVQALLLFAIALHSDNVQEKSAEVKDMAIELALDLGMNMREFSENALDGTQTGRVMAESLRRTWWELYYLDGLIAGFHQKDSFKLHSVLCTVPLPCEEKEYATGRIPEPKSLQDFDERYFASSTTVFSSFSYRVDAVRILGQVLAVGQGSDPEDPAADAADASLVTWSLHLPDCKKELVGEDRRVDEMLFQAHMVIYAATIYLHRPKSHIAMSAVPDDTSCTPQARWVTASKPRELHTVKAIAAANTISKLVTLPAPLIKHTPFFTCVITLAAIVHLSACSWVLTGDEGFLAKERIRLGVGALKTLAEVWSVADCVLMQVKGVARDVFSLQVPAGATRSGIITQEEMYRFIDEERTLEIVGGEADYHGLPELDWNGELGLI